MSDIWTRARCDARNLRRRLEAGNTAPAAIINAALADAGLFCHPVAPGDGLLGGAHAVLNRELDAIWIRADAPDDAAAFLVAHELAHFHLHPEYSTSPEYEGATDTGDTNETGAFLIGYGPCERRETEANAWARELLLPATIARIAFFDGGQSAAEIAARFSVPLSVAVRQLQASALPESAPCTESEPAPLPLDPSQHAAATTTNCPLLLGAGPGTGKTRTLAARVKHLLETGVAPETVLVLTFSRKATAELRERLEKHLPATVARRVSVCTFHAFGFDLLRRYHRHADIPASPALLSEAEAFALLEMCFAALAPAALWYPHDPTFPLRDCQKLIGKLKEELVTPSEATARATVTGDAKLQAVCALYERYEAALRAAGVLDAADLVCRAVTLLTEIPAVREREQARWAHLLVDEYQDTNRAGAKLVQLLGGTNRGVWCVGDLRQAIYRFRGASPANVSRFSEDFPGATRQDLAVNYRSRPPLVSCFGQLADDNAVLWQAERTEAANPCITLAIADTDAAQAHGIAAEMNRLRSENAAYSWNDFAILCRTNPQAAALRAALESHGIPTTGNPAPLAWLRDPTVRELLLLLSLSAGNREGALAARTGRILPEGLRGKTVPADFFTEALYGASGLARAVQNPAAVQALLSLAQSFGTGEKQSVSPAAAFLEHIRRVARLGQAPRTADDAEPAASANAVQVLTVHAAKGLEFAAVFVPNLSQAHFPPNPPPGIFAGDATAALLGTTAADAAEETRLFFVAVTRARDYLTLSRAEKYGDRTAQASPLLEPLAAIPEVATVRWTTTAPPPAAPPNGSDTGAGDTQPTPAHELDSYLRCPRRYFYETVRGYGDLRERSPYDALKSALRSHLQGGDVPKPTEPEPADPWRDAYRAEWDALRARADSLGELAPAPTYRHELPEGTVTVRADCINADGTVTLLTFSKSKQTGQADAVNTLLFSAVPEGTAVCVNHVRTGEVRRIEPTQNPSTRRARENHLAAYNRALRGIRLRVFPAKPAEKDDCAGCAYLLICD